MGGELPSPGENARQKSQFLMDGLIKEKGPVGSE